MKNVTMRTYFMIMFMSCCCFVKRTIFDTKNVTPLFLPTLRKWGRNLLISSVKVSFCMSKCKTFYWRFQPSRMLRFDQEKCTKKKWVDPLQKSSILRLKTPLFQSGLRVLKSEPIWERPVTTLASCILKSPHIFYPLGKVLYFKPKTSIFKVGRPTFTEGPNRAII